MNTSRAPAPAPPPFRFDGGIFVGAVEGPPVTGLEMGRSEPERGLDDVKRSHPFGAMPSTSIMMSDRVM